MKIKIGECIFKIIKIQEKENLKMKKIGGKFIMEDNNLKIVINKLLNIFLHLLKIIMAELL